VKSFNVSVLEADSFQRWYDSTNFPEKVIQVDMGVFRPVTSFGSGREIFKICCKVIIGQTLRGAISRFEASIYLATIKTSQELKRVVDIIISMEMGSW